MKERPILFSAPMVRAILEGRKTMTRRVVNPQPDVVERGVCFFDGDGTSGPGSRDRIIYCPYGKPGDRLWVRETWSKDPNSAQILYRAGAPGTPGSWVTSTPFDSWRPSIHMSRWASRILLEVTAVKVEQVQKISDEDILSEGIKIDPAYSDEYGCHVRYRRAFREIWDSINSKRGYGWDSNPWVWVISFKRIDSI